MSKRLATVEQLAASVKRRKQYGPPLSHPAWGAASTSQRVRALMILHDWSLEDLAKHAGLTKQAWSKTLRRSEWTASQLVRVASAFKITAGDLIQIPADCSYDPDLWTGEDL